MAGVHTIATITANTDGLGWIYYDGGNPEKKKIKGYNK